MKRLEDGRAYCMAQLIAYAVNDPQRMPKFDKVFPDGKPARAQDADEIWQAMKEWADMVQLAERQNG